MLGVPVSADAAPVQSPMGAALFAMQSCLGPARGPASAEAKKAAAEARRPITAGKGFEMLCKMGWAGGALGRHEEGVQDLDALWNAKQNTGRGLGGMAKERKRSKRRTSKEEGAGDLQALQKEVAELRRALADRDATIRALHAELARRL